LVIKKGIETVNTKFPGLQIDNHLMWKNHTEQMICMLHAAYYAIRSVVHISNITTLKSIYYAYFHSVIKYRIIFGGNSPDSVKIFILQQKIIRILAGAQPRTSGRSILKHLEISPFPCQYIFSLIKFNYH